MHIALRSIAFLSLVILLFSPLFFFTAGVQHAFGSKEELKVVSHSHFIDKDGLFHVVGEVENNIFGRVAEDIKIYSVFHGQEKSETVTTESAPVFIDKLRPGERSPFSIVVEDPSDVRDIKGYHLTAISANQSSISLAPALKLRTNISEAQINEDGIYHLAGNIVNYGSESATKIVVAACFYDSNSTVIYTTY
jgi:hypothetical protein